MTASSILCTFILCKQGTNRFIHHRK